MLNQYPYNECESCQCVTCKAFAESGCQYCTKCKANGTCMGIQVDCPCSGCDAADELTCECCMK